MIVPNGNVVPRPPALQSFAHAKIEVLEYKKDETQQKSHTQPRNGVEKHPVRAGAHTSHTYRRGGSDGRWLVGTLAARAVTHYVVHKMITLYSF